MANVIVAIAKDEDNLIVDFVVHHLAVGFDRVIIFDDASRNEIGTTMAALPTGLRDRVTCYRLETGLETWKANPPVEFFDEELFKALHHSKQMYLYNFTLRQILLPTDWVAFIDIDEFMWFGKYQTVSKFRSELEIFGFSAAIFDMLLYGHSFNIVPPNPNNICAFVWRAASYYGHGKIFAKAGAVKAISTPHYPQLHSPGLLADVNFKVRDTETGRGERRTSENYDRPHLKHFIIQDVVTCCRRRIRSRISSSAPMSATNRSWLDRIGMMETTSVEIDEELAVSILAARARQGLGIVDHLKALTNALERVEIDSPTGGALDFDFLRASVAADVSATNGQVLFDYFTSEDQDTSFLHFLRPPDGFEPQRYRMLNRDLANFSNWKLVDHFLRYGRAEGRVWK
jgi:hypothetical protein